MVLSEGFLKDLKGSFKRPEVLLPAIERHVVRTRGDDDEERRSDILHPSEMAKGTWCPTHDYFRIVGAKANATERPPSFTTINKWTEGHDIHHKYQRWLWQMGRLWGKFQCKACDYSWLDMSPRTCQLCGSPRLRYREVPISDTSLMLAGHGDGVVGLGEGEGTDVWDEFVFLEVKSIGVTSLRIDAPMLYDRYLDEQLTIEEVWFFINRPFSSHLRQGMTYLHIAQQMYPHLGLEKVLFLYEWKPTQEAKEFVVNYHPTIANKMIGGAEVVANGVRNHVAPERPGWAESPESKGCQNCEYRTACWGVAQAASASPAVGVLRSSSAHRRRALRPKAPG